MDSLKVEDIIPASAKRIYSDWLSSNGHTDMTGGEAEISDQSGAEFTAWDGYISGSNIQLDSNEKIKQHWRTVEFPESAADSILEVKLEPINESSTKVIITQTNLPDGDGPKYTDGWRDHYFSPMKQYYKNL